MSRTAMMYIEISCFLSCFCGWILICSTLPTEYWNFSEVGETVLTTVNYYSNLWMDCISDTTGVSDCKYYPSMMALPGLSGMAVYSMWGNRMRAEFVDINYKPQKFELGAALFIGWGGSSLVICGGAVLCYFSGREGFSSGSNNTLLGAEAYTRAQSRGTYVTARTRRAHMLPAYSKPTTTIMTRFYSGRESKGNRRTQRTYRACKTAAPMLNMDSYV
ncbi:claudin-10 isoform X2 [Neoarius graeffei]|uniref:claudin-10 isoform X2 n=1 Tax=Neoarius graeffei TaxID=443677 RepID=UPI00298C6234|nr:claudin-10 isoform X2 [Neoarius graeffei]